MYEKLDFVVYGRLPNGIRHGAVFVDKIKVYKNESNEETIITNLQYHANNYFRRSVQLHCNRIILSVFKRTLH